MKIVYVTVKLEIPDEYDPDEVLENMDYTFDYEDYTIPSEIFEVEE